MKIVSYDIMNAEISNKCRSLEVVEFETFLTLIRISVTACCLVITEMAKEVADCQAGDVTSTSAFDVRRVSTTLLYPLADASPRGKCPLGPTSFTRAPEINHSKMSIGITLMAIHILRMTL